MRRGKKGKEGRVRERGTRRGKRVCGCALTGIAQGERICGRIWRGMKTEEGFAMYTERMAGGERPLWNRAPENEAWGKVGREEVP